ncbi:oligosaccharide flippase family protein [Amylibacter sp.]|jgi:O-antigen/teichoic acid export membrane protein|nr:oligosaccharide flippase family protein [Amylibacter sp.]
MKSNLIANYFGQFWRLFMSVFFIPIYVKMLGAEAYGLIGAFAILQSSVAILDMGMRPATSRELARYTGGIVSLNKIWNLLRTVEIITFAISILLFLVIYFVSEWLTVIWLNNTELTNERVSSSLCIMGAILALSFIESLYSNCLIGLQKQVIFNFILILSSSMKGIGAILVLNFFSASIEAFFYWQLICVIFSVVAFAIFTYGNLPRGLTLPNFSMYSLQEVWKFAAGMTGVTLTALILTQVDKVMLSKFLPLQEFGYYTLAFLVSNSLYTLITPVSQAYLPKLTEAVAEKNDAAVLHHYHSGAQLVSALAGSAAIVIYLYSDRILLAWTGDLLLVQEISLIVCFLTVGTFLNGLAWMPFQLQVAYGWTKLTLKINILLILTIIPSLFLVIPSFGALGVAYVWILLNTLSLIIGITIMHKRLLMDQKFTWILKDVAQPIIVAYMAAKLIGSIVTKSESQLIEAINIFIIVILTALSSLIFCDRLRAPILLRLKNWF